MKRISILVLVLVFVSLAGCTKEDPIREEGFTEVLLPDFMRNSLKSGSGGGFDVGEVPFVVLGKNGKEVDGTIRLTMPANAEYTIYKMEISNNIFELTALEPNFLLIAEEKGILNFTKSSCIAHCQEVFTTPEGEKIEGRGRCKAQCWAMALAPVAAAIIIALL